MSSSRRCTVWFVGLTIYALAVFHRSSLAVAGLAATERFAAGDSMVEFSPVER